MAASLEDHERRIAALEQAAKRDRSVERAVAEIVAESERRTADEIERLKEHVDARVSAAERRMIDVLNERFDQVMTALDRPKPRAAKKKGGKR